MQILNRTQNQFAKVRPRCRVLAVASGGGHWVQLFRLRAAWDDCAVTYVTTTKDYQPVVLADAARRGQPPPRFFSVTFASRWHRWLLLYQALQILVIVLRVRPDVIVTTGAAPGYFAVRIGRFVRTRTVWIDSIANAKELSLSGKKAGNHVSLWLTQWKHLEGSMKPARDGPEFYGGTL